MHLEKDLEDIETEIKNKNRDLDDSLQKLKSVCKDAIEKLENHKNSQSEYIKRFNKEIEDAKKEKSLAFESIQKLEVQVEMIRRSPNSLCRYDYLSTSNDEIAELIRVSFNVNYTKLKDLYSDLDRTASYNFGRRARLNSLISRTEKELYSTAKGLIESFSIQKKDELESLRRNIIDIDDHIADVNREISSILSGDRKRSEMLSSYRRLFDLYDNGQIPELKEISSVPEKDILKATGDIYIQANKDLDVLAIRLSDTEAGKLLMLQRDLNLMLLSL